MIYILPAAFNKNAVWKGEQSTMKKILRNSCLSLCIFVLSLGLGVVAHAQTPAPAAASSCGSSTGSAADAELKDAAGKAPATADLAKGDPGGTITGTINDVPAADSKVGVTLPDVANQVGQNKIAINFIWTLVTGFLVMFMQAGFAMVEVGPVPRQKRQPHVHDELLRVHVRVVRLLDHRLRHTDGRRGRQRQPGRPAIADAEHSMSLFGKTWGIFGAVRNVPLRATPMTSASWSSSCSKWCSWIRP